MLLLDTHTYLWFISDNPLLPQWVSEEIQTSENVFVSIASFWEIAIKNAKGLLDIQVPVSKMMEDCALLNFTVLPINGMHLDKLKVLPYIHKDPFDRILICQAQAEDMKLVTAQSMTAKPAAPGTRSSTPVKPECS